MPLDLIIPIIQGVSKIALQCYFKCYCVASITKKGRTKYPSFNVVTHWPQQRSPSTVTP
jgi:hypothetical protein